MNYFKLLSFSCLMLTITCCIHKTNNDQSLSNSDSLKQISERISIDFSVTEDQVKSQIVKRFRPFFPADKEYWEKKGWLEYRLLNGKKMYFNRAASNLMLLKTFYEQKDERQNKMDNDSAKIFRRKHTQEVLKTVGNNSTPVVPVDMKITYTITVKKDVVPDGETIRCWMPWPKENYPRQKNIKLLNISNQGYIISPDSSIHSTLFIEEKSKHGLPTVFEISFLYQSSAQYFNLVTHKPLPYDKTTANYIKYTSEQLPQICFTEHIKRLADSITGPEENPLEVVRKIYSWFKENIPWTGALEYSIIPNIPEYVYTNRRGDCGMQTFLYMSMLRYKGIPVRWQSGWKVPPGNENLHDWCEIFYEGIGWVPSDISYDLQKSEIPEIKQYYLSGIDSYRLIVNDGISGPLHPGKQFMRSDPYDFQRGELEWKGGNLYFDKWDYHMKIEYLK